MFKSYGKFWKNYVDFSGKTKRKDYWLAFLMNVIVNLILIIPSAFIIAKMVASNETYAFTTASGEFTFNIASTPESNWLSILLMVFSIFNLIIIIPSISIAVRRLRDAGYHWAFIFIGLIPFIGRIALIVLMCMPTSDLIESTKKVHQQNVDPDELKKWYQLKEEGVITDKEYEAKKKELF